MSELSEMKKIKRFIAACRRQWPGAMITLRQDTTTDAASQVRCGQQRPNPSTGPRKDLNMADEFTEHDLDTPTEADLDLAYGSKYLSSGDIGDRKIRTKIAKVRKDELRGNDGVKKMKFVIFFSDLDKAMVLNTTNKDALVGSLGRTPANWIGATVGIYVDPNVTYAGKRMKGLRLRVLGAAEAPPKPTPAPSPTPKPKPTAASASVAWPEEKDDPGPEFNDDVPDFSPAAA
jgi:hypothetical protein